MRTLWRNRRKLYYRLWLGVDEVLDEDGNIVETGIPIYSDPIELKATITSERGQAFRESTTVEAFGIDVFYDKLLIVDDPNFLKYDSDGNRVEDSEATIFYIDKEPYIEGEISSSFDYRATKVSHSLNTTVVTLKRVDVT